MTTRQLTCIGCPMGCALTAVIEDGAVVSVSGNTCKRGDAYARKECVAPARVVTGTVRIEGASAPVLPVRTKGEVPKDMVLEVAREMRHICAKAPVKIGDVIAEDICGTGIALTATANAGRI